ncbi:MAG: sigma 54-interacting transcriptional regulator [Polyangiales bacterium]
MADASQTVDLLTVDRHRVTRVPLPGAVILFSSDQVTHAVMPARDGVVEFGRDRLAELGLRDSRVSRAHAVARWEQGAWAIRDEGSRNGTTVDGASVGAVVRTGERAVIRVGDTVAWLVPDVLPYAERAVSVEGNTVVGATLAASLNQIRQAAEGHVLHITGPSGSGKELAARAFHAMGPTPRGPFVAINCAAIPEGVAERVLFGARKGAYSGAHADAPGHMQEADGGTLFLDEVGELSLEVQAKLLRALEAREVIPVGASKPQSVNLRFCSATHRDLRERVADKRFREDLYFRIGRPQVSLPPLRERREEIPTVIDRELKATGRSAHASLVETCLVRPWPGNVRELIVEIGAAGRAAAAAGDGRVRAGDLAPSAGTVFTVERSTRDEAARTPPPVTPAPPSEPSPRRDAPGRDEIEAALRAHGGRIASAARALGMHRNQLRRWVAANNVDPKLYARDDAPSASDED